MKSASTEEIDLEKAHQFVRVELTPKMHAQARYHAMRRSQNIRRQFIPQNAPLSHLESNYIGVLGEIALKLIFGARQEPEDNYAAGQVDQGDISIGGLIYDIKTEAIPERFYNRLYEGRIMPHEPYGCRVWTALHYHHLKKYSGGILFAAVPVPDDAKKDRAEDKIRRRIENRANHLIIIGAASQHMFTGRHPTQYSPADPVSGKKRRYNSPNYVFHHSELIPLHVIQK